MLFLGICSIVPVDMKQGTHKHDGQIYIPPGRVIAEDRLTLSVGQYCIFGSVSSVSRTSFRLGYSWASGTRKPGLGLLSPSKAVTFDRLAHQGLRASLHSIRFRHILASAFYPLDGARLEYRDRYPIYFVDSQHGMIMKRFRMQSFYRASRFCH